MIEWIKKFFRKSNVSQNNKLVKARFTEDTLPCLGCKFEETDPLDRPCNICLGKYKEHFVRNNEKGE